MTHCIAILLAGALLIASAGGVDAQTAATVSSDDADADSRTVPLALQSVGRACSQIWASQNDGDVEKAAMVTIHAATIVAASYSDELNGALAATGIASTEYDDAYSQLTSAYPAAFSAALKAGLDYAKVNPDDPVAQKKFFAATPAGVIVLGLQANLEGSLSRLKVAEAKAYLALTKYNMALETAREVRSCADDQRTSLKKGAAAAAAQTQSGAAAAALSPVGSWRYVNGKDGMTLSIGGRPPEYVGTVGIDTLGGSTPGTITIRKQSEGIFAGSMTFGNHTDGIKVTIAEDGKSLTLTGNGTGQVTFILEK